TSPRNTRRRTVSPTARSPRSPSACWRDIRGAATCASSRTRCIAPCCSPPVQHAVNNAVAVTRGLVGRTVADVERDLILDTLDHCLGNRTHAANILGISIRTLRNKLREYSSSGLAIPQHGEARMAG